MKVAFISELFPPFAPGGGEWSTYYLAKNLSKENIKIVVITPNLGASDYERKDGFTVLRFPFFLKTITFNKLAGNFFFTNPLWLVWASFWYFVYLKRENPDVIHIHGKYSIPPVVIANFFLKKPTIATIRDYMSLCSYGMCLMRSNKACNLWEYIIQDFPEYYKNYVNDKNLFNLSLNILFATYGRLSTYYLNFFTKFIGTITCLSNKQKDILEKNGLSKSILVIRNSFIFQNNPKLISKSNVVLYVGRLTPGKGVNLLLEAIPQVNKKLSNLKYVFIGSGHLKQDLLKAKRKYNIVLKGQLPHKDVTSYFQKSQVTVVPSIWPDPMPRTGIESLSYLTPVVITARGGLPELVKDGVYGYIASANSESLAEKIILAIKNNQKLTKNIQKDYEKLKKEFMLIPTRNYIKIYELMISR